MQATTHQRLRRASTLTLIAASAALLAACASQPEPKGMVNPKPRSKEYFAETEYGVKASPRVQFMAAILEEETGKGAFPFILHCFSSGRRLAEIGVALGGYVSFSGILTFKNSPELRAIAADLPHDRLLVETDAPYLAPIPFRGKRNEPAYVAHTAKVLADTIGVSEQEIATLTTNNFFRLFGKMPRPDLRSA